MSGEELTIALSGDDLRLRLFWDAGKSRPMLEVTFRGLEPLVKLYRRYGDPQVCIDVDPDTGDIDLGWMGVPRTYFKKRRAAIDTVEWRIAFDAPQGTRMLRAGCLGNLLDHEGPDPAGLVPVCVEYCAGDEEAREKLRPRIAQWMGFLREDLTRECERLCTEAKTRRTA